MAPPVIRERVIPVLESHVLPALSHVPGPLFKSLALYVILQIMISESATVQAAWRHTKQYTPQPVHNAVAAAGETSVGGAVWGATLAIRAASNRVFQPVRAIHEDQQEKGASAGEGLVQMQQAIDALGEVPVAGAQTTLDDIMKEIESTKQATPRR